MILERMVELLILSNIETYCNNDSDFFIYIEQHFDINKINNRYTKLLDEFLNQYALNKTEKSD